MKKVTDFGVVQSNGTLIFNYTLNQSAIVAIKIFNLQGKEIISLPVVSRNADTYTENLQIAKCGLSKGKYIVNLSAGSMIKTTDIVLQ
jgi:hypothetical protein